MKRMEKLVTLAMTEHDISHSVGKLFAGENHFLWYYSSVFLTLNIFLQRRKGAKSLSCLASLREKNGDLAALREIN